MKIEDIDMSVTLYNQLLSHGIFKLEDLKKFTYEDVMKWRNLGRRSLEELLRITRENDIEL